MMLRCLFVLTLQVLAVVVGENLKFNHATNVKAPTAKNPTLRNYFNLKERDQRQRFHIFLKELETDNIPGKQLKDDHLQAPSAKCQCVNQTCGCCAMLDFDVFEYDHTGCVNLTYLPAPEYGVRVTFTLDNTTFVNKTVSVRNPPAICFQIPYLEKYMHLCIDFYNMNFTKQAASGCVKIQLRVFLIVSEEIKLGCFHFGPKSQQSMMKVIQQFIRQHSHDLKNLHSSNDIKLRDSKLTRFTNDLWKI